MAYTRVTATRNGAKAIDYAMEEKEGHKEGDMDRVLMVGGNNIDIDNAKEQMEAVWKAYNKDKGDYRQVYRIIQSFRLDDLDPNNPEDVEKANKIGVETGKTLYPDRQVLVITQADGKGGKLHNHILANSVSFIDGRSLRNEGYIVNMDGVDLPVYSKELDDIRSISDSIIQKYGISPIVPDADKNIEDKRTLAEISIAQEGKYVWKDDIKARIERCLSDTDVIDKNSFIESMRENYEVDVNYRSKKTMSYNFIDNGDKKRAIRGKTLGSNYDIETLDNTFKENVKLQKKEEENYFDFDVLGELSKIRPTTEKRVVAPVSKKDAQTESKAANNINKEVSFEDMFDNMLLDVGVKPLKPITKTEVIEETTEVEKSKNIDIEDNKEDIEAKKQRDLKQKQEEKERQKLQQQEEQRLLEEQEGQRLAQERREKVAIERIKICTKNSVSNEFIKMYVEKTGELAGTQKKNGITGKMENINVMDIYKATEKQLQADRETTTQQTIERNVEVVADDGPDL